ncbi:MAG: LptF/LptG family permease [Candidatus Aminicenantales bacterium]
MTFFRRYEEELDVESLYPVVSEKKKVREKDIQELWRDARAIKEELGALPASEKMKLSYRQRERELTSHWVEIHKKLALPFSCIIFALLGLPLGAFTKKGGRTSGFTLSIGIILLYYILITAGEQLAMEGRMSAFIGMWGPNVLFLALGLYFFVLSVRETSFRAFWTQLGRRARWFAIPPRARTRGGMPRVSPPFPNILDRYVLRKYLAIFGLVFVSLLAVYAIVTFFERIDRLYENEKPLRLLLSFIWFKIPEFVHTILPVSALAATLLSLGLLTKFNEVTAMKACGISLYRLTLPVLLMGGVVSVAAFSLQENVMPYSNKRAEHVWNEITNVPARSTSYLDRRWVLGRNKSRIYHYRYFDSLSSTFSQISVYDIDPESWLLRRRFFGVKGVLQNGELTLSDAWSREFLEETKAQFEKRASMTLSPVEESRYFLREWKEPDQMSYAELRKYIRDIQERGFETTRFRVDLNVKLSFPIASLLMALLGIPFAFWMGKRGTLVGIGLSVAIAMVYWGGLGVFRSLGYVQALGPVLAAWGPNLIFGGVGLILLSTLRT